MKLLLVILIALLALPLLALETGAPPASIQSRESFRVIGLEVKNTMEQADMMNLWVKFLDLVDQIKSQVPGPYYGISFYDDDYDPRAMEGYGYLAAVEVSRDAEVPEGFVSRIVPAGTYAVFTHKGKIEEISNTFNYIFGEWFRSSGKTPVMQDLLELYPDGFDGASEDSQMQIWVPILAE